MRCVESLIFENQSSEESVPKLRNDEQSNPTDFTSQ